MGSAPPADLAVVRDALARAGVDPTYFGEFTTPKWRETFGGGELDYGAAAPTLVECLDQVEDPQVLEAVVRSLSTSAARGIALVPLIRLFRRTPNEQFALKWATGNALATVAGREDLPMLYELAIDTEHVGRGMLVGELWRLSDPDPVPRLRELASDPDCAFGAMSSLRRKLTPEDARAVIAPLTEHSDERVRNAARTNLKRIDKRLKR